MTETTQTPNEPEAIIIENADGTTQELNLGNQHTYEQIAETPTTEPAPTQATNPNEPKPVFNNPNPDPLAGLDGLTGQTPGNIGNNNVLDQVNSQLSSFKEEILGALEQKTQTQTIEQQKAELEQADAGWTSYLTKAIEAGDVAGQVKAQKNLAIIASKKEGLKAQKETPAKTTPEQTTNPLDQKLEQLKNDPFVQAHAQNWQNRNKDWFEKPGFELQTASFNQAVDHLVKEFAEGRSNLSPGTAEFYTKIDDYLITKYGNGSNINPRANASQATLPGVGMTANNQTSANPRLTSEHIQVLRDLGISATDTETIKAVANEYKKRQDSGRVRTN